MNARTSGLTAAFIDTQRRRLLELQSTLSSTTNSDLDDETRVKEENADRAREYEDDAQKLAALELDGNLVTRDLRRLKQIDRALEKIANGTYGLSDASGAPIPQERLEALPEAICTLSEEQQVERAS
ncbi:MAG: TraR/DksA family transcriptional regulator [Gammaproteobacteria bacterium]